MNKPKHILILGCGRSGTSIFGELFEHLPCFNYHSEPSFADLLNFDFTTSTAIKVPKESDGFTPTIGLSFPLEILLKLIPEVTIFWQVRNPLDTVCSLKVGISRNWGHHPQPPDWQNWLTEPLVKRCAHHWNYLNSIGFEQVKNLATITKFETMIDNPVAFATQVCQKIGVDISFHEKAIKSWAKRVQNSNNKDFIEAHTSRAYSTNDHQVRVGRWKENMTEEEQGLVWPMVAETAQRFGYVLSFN